MKKKKIFTFTVGRSDFGILENILLNLEKDKRFDSQLIIGSVHLSKIFGETKKDINSKIFKNTHLLKYELSNTDTNLNILNILNATLKILNKNKPNACIILGDRYEMLAIAIASFSLNIPIFHLCGGSETTGSLDNVYRNNISKMATAHFLESDKHKKNLRKINIKKNLFVIGAPGLEKINKDLINIKNFEEKFKFRFDKSKKILVCCFHPETTISIKKNLQNLKIFLNFLKKIKQNVIFTYPNADKGYIKYIILLKKFSKIKNFKIIKNLGKINYFSLLKFSNVVIGNSSSGIIETSSFKIPAINIGERQNRRFANKNVLNTKFDAGQIYKKYKIATSERFNKKLKNIKNLYYKPNTSKNFVRFAIKVLQKHKN